MAKGGLLVSVVTLLAVLTVAEGMLVTLENDMTESMAIHCHSKYEGDLGLQYVNPGGIYSFTVPGKFFSGKQYSCTFEAAGKRSTNFDVFWGWGGVHNSPCNCLGDSCPWHVTADGFSCNNGEFSRGWGN